jgi:hypothetical protein
MPFTTVMHELALPGYEPKNVDAKNVSMVIVARRSSREDAVIHHDIHR